MPVNLKLTLRISSLVVAASLCAPAVADPPRHAPAHGWRRHHGDDRHHDADFVGYTGQHWQQDYDIRSGRCNRQAIATAVGGVVGGIVAANVSRPENRTVATLIGAAAGALLGHKIGHELDEADRGCFGHAMEIGETGRRVVWTNEGTGVRYELAPGGHRDRDGHSCRAFTLVAIDGRHSTTQAGVACRSQIGAWQVMD